MPEFSFQYWWHFAVVNWGGLHQYLVTLIIFICNFKIFVIQLGKESFNHIVRFIKAKWFQGKMILLNDFIMVFKISSNCHTSIRHKSSLFY